MIKIKVHKLLISPYLWGVLCVGILFLFKNNSEICEKYYSNMLYPVLNYCISIIPSIFGFSFSDLFYLLIALLVIVLLVQVIRKKIRFMSFLRKIIALVIWLYVLFNILWGFNYFRSPLNERLDIARSASDTTQLKDVCIKVIEQCNINYVPLDSFYSKQEIEQVIKDDYHAFGEIVTIPDELLNSAPVKHITLSGFFAKAGILGYYGPYFGEVHINNKLQKLNMPITIAHEIAHKLGIASEAEANAYAWMLCTRSEEKQIRYAAAVFAVEYFAYELKSQGLDTSILRQLKPEVIKDIQDQNKYWRKLRNKRVNNAMSKVNDAYLKSNNVKDGVADYSNIVQLIVDLHNSEMQNLFFKQTQ